MRITEFDIYRDLLKERAGVILPPEKSSMLDSRLGPVIKKWGYRSMESLTLALQGMPGADLISDVIEAMATHETAFFRDGKPFRYIGEHVIPELAKARARKKTLRFWSAACATGQEAYSLAILLKEAALTGWKTEILATDMSYNVLEQARSGTFSQLEVQRGLSIRRLLKHFDQQNANAWQLHDSVRKLVRFEAFNLLEPMENLGAFDVILCRNVLAHFEEGARMKVLGNLAARVNSGGYLILGAGEDSLDMPPNFILVPGQRGIYKNTK